MIPLNDPPAYIQHLTLAAPMVPCHCSPKWSTRIYPTHNPTCSNSPQSVFSKILLFPTCIYPTPNPGCPYDPLSVSPFCPYSPPANPTPNLSWTYYPLSISALLPMSHRQYHLNTPISHLHNYILHLTLAEIWSPVSFCKKCLYLSPSYIKHLTLAAPMIPCQFSFICPMSDLHIIHM